MLDSLSSLAGPVAYLVVAVLAALEASAFVGLFIPGELALLTGGYIAHQGNASLGLMMGVAAAGAIAGDSLGYEIGRRFGPALQASRLVVRRGFGDGGQCGSAPLDLGDDLLGGLGPDEGLGVVVPVFGPCLDALDENVDARERAAA